MSERRFWVTTTSKFFLLLALIALLAVGYGVIKSAVRRAEIEREVQALRTEIEDHRSKSEQLTKLTKYLETEEYQEKEARLELGLQKPGESVVVIQNLTDNNQDQAAAAEKNLPNWKLWLNYFLGLK